MLIAGTILPQFADSHSGQCCTKCLLCKLWSSE